MSNRNFGVCLLIFLVELSRGKGEPPQSVTVGGIFLTEDGLLADVLRESVSHLNSDDRILPLTAVMDSPSMISGDELSLHSSTCRSMSLHVMTVFSGCGLHDSVVGSVSGHSNIPHLSTELVSTTNAGQFSLYIGPSREDMDLAITDILQRRQFNKVLIVTHQQTGLLNVQSMMEELQISGVDVLIADIDNKEKDWDRFTNRRVQVIVVDMGIKFVHYFIEQALKVRLLNEESTVVFTSLDFSSMDLEEVRHTGAILLGFSLLNRNTIEDRYIDRDFPGLVTLQTLLKRDYRAALIFDAVNLFGKALEQLSEKMSPPVPAVSCKNNAEVYTAGQEFLSVFRNISHTGVTGNMRFVRQHREEIKLYVQQIVDTKLIKTVGSWTKHVDQENTDLLLNEVVRKKAEPLQLKDKSKKIKVQGILGKFLLERKEEKKEGNGRYFGFLKDLLDGLMTQMEFDYEIFVEEEYEHFDKGFFNPETGNWTGMIGRLLNKEVDIAVGDVTMTSERSSVLDFSVPYMTSQLVAVLKKPSHISPLSFMTILFPFPATMWLTLLFTLFFCSILLVLVAMVSPYERHSIPRSADDKLGFLNAAWISLSGLFLKSVNIPIQAMSTRAFCCCCWMLALLIVVLYSSSLHRLLSSPVEKKTLDKFLEEESSKFGVITNGSTQQLLLNSADPNLKDVVNRLVPIRSVSAGVAKVLSEDQFSFLIEFPQLPLSSQCDLETVGKFGRVHYGLAFRRGSWLTQVFNSVLLNMIESGEIQTLIDRWIPEQSCQDSQTVAVNPLPFYGCLLFLLLAGVFCLLLSFLELAYFSFHESTSYNTWWKVLRGELENIIPTKDKDDKTPRSPVYLKDIYASNQMNITDSPFKQSSSDDESPIKNGYKEDLSITDSNIQLLNNKRNNLMFENS